MKLYSSVEKVTKCVVYTKYGSSHVHISRNYPHQPPSPPPPPKKKKKNLDLDSLSMHLPESSN